LGSRRIGSRLGFRSSVHTSLFFRSSSSGSSRISSILGSLRSSRSS